MRFIYFNRVKRTLAILNRNEKIICLNNFLGSLVSRMLTPYWPLYIKFLGADMVQYGALGSISSAVGVAVRLPGGYIADHYGRKKIILLTGFIGIFIPLSYVFINEWFWLLPGMVVGTFLGIAGPAWSALQADSIPDKRRSTMFSIFNLLQGISFGIGPMMGAFLISLSGGEVSLNSIRIILFMEFLSNLGLWFIYTRFEETIGKSDVHTHAETGTSLRKRATSFFYSFYAIIKGNRALTAWLVIRVINTFVFYLYGAYSLFYVFDVMKLSGPFVLAAIYTLVPVTQAIFAVPIGRAIDKIGRKPFVTFYMLFDASLVLWFIFIRNPITLFLNMGLTGLLNAIYISWSVLEVELVPSAHRGRWMATVGLVTGIVTMPAPILGGYLWTQIDPSAPFICYITLTLVALFIFISHIPETLHRPSYQKAGQL